jgi:hypothetical protein
MKTRQGKNPAGKKTARQGKGSGSRVDFCKTTNKKSAMQQEKGEICQKR